MKMAQKVYPTKAPPPMTALRPSSAHRERCAVCGSPLCRFCCPQVTACADGDDDLRCEDTTLEDRWYFDGLLDALVEMMDIHKKRVMSDLAETEVTAKVIDALEYARQERSLVRIEGNSRYGKTCAVKTCCAASPGKWRLIQTPSTNGERDLYEAIAEALGISFALTTTTRELRGKIEFVIKHGGLMLVMDEAHFIWPANYSRNTAPARINWLRTQVVDREVPLVLVTTPQDYEQRRNKFVKHTSFNESQFAGRVTRTIRLPDKLKQADLVAVARKHFPELTEGGLLLIAAKARQTQNYLAAVQQIAKLARYIARRDNHPKVTSEDLELAICEVIPHAAAPVEAAAIIESPLTTSNPIATRRGTRPGPANTAAPQILDSPASREITPQTETLQPV
jgi:DNA transposition AAA+ family ATPase